MASKWWLDESGNVTSEARAELDAWMVEIEAEVAKGLAP
jgi:hypothetical protein